MSKILVTGASGFIGGHLAHQLRALGHDVRCLVRPTSRVERLTASGVEIVHGDVTEADGLARALDGVDMVYHVAGLTFALSDRDLRRVNGESLEIIARTIASRESPPTLLVVSSIAAAGPTSRDSMRTENDEPRPVSKYGESKLEGERVARRWAAELPITIVRPGVVFGPYDPGLQPVLQNVYRLRLHVNPGFRSPRLSLIHVGDLVDLMIRAAQSGERLEKDGAGSEPGRGIYHGVVREHLTYVEMGRILAQGVLPGKTIFILRVPGLALWAAASANEIVSQLRRRAHIFSRDKLREGMAASWVCSGEKADVQLGFRPADTLRERLMATGRWYREHGWV